MLVSEANNALCQYANGADRTLKKVFQGATDLSTKMLYKNWQALNCSDGYVYTAPVGSFVANDFGLYDMQGNVWEWVEDCSHPSYVGAPHDGSAWTSGGECEQHVVRGRSWSALPTFLAPAARGRTLSPLYWDDLSTRNWDQGFRLARTLN